MKSKTLLFGIFFSVATWQTLSAAPILTLDTPDLSGLPGSTVGWGFNLTNDTDYLVITSTDYVSLDDIGVYFDFVYSFGVFQVVGPAPESPTWSQPFDPLAGTGLGSYTINDFEPAGSLSTGNLIVTYDLFSVSPNDPSFDPTADTLMTGQTLSAPASVLASGDVSAPEPGTMALTLLGLFGAFCRLSLVNRKKRQSGSN